MRSRPWYVYVFLGALLGGLAYMVYFKPRQGELKALRAERMKTESDVAQLRVKKKQLDKIESELAGLTAAMAELEAIIPRKKEIGEILRNVQQMASDARLEVIHIAQDKEIIKEFYSEQPIPIEVVGAYHNLGTFFDRLLHFQRLFNIDDFSIRALPDQSEDTTISVLFTAKTYLFLEEALLKKPEPVKSKKPLKEDIDIE
jgi:Tfp pilus assembly protein PilO